MFPLNARTYKVILITRALNNPYRIVSIDPITSKLKTVEFHCFVDMDEPSHDKTCLCHMRIARAQISMRIRTV